MTSLPSRTTLWLYDSTSVPSDLGTRYSRAPSAGILLIIDTSKNIKCRSQSWMFSYERHFLLQRWKYAHPQLLAKVWNTHLSSLPPLPLMAAKGGPGKPTQHRTQLVPQVEKLQVAPLPFITSLWSPANRPVSYTLILEDKTEQCQSPCSDVSYHQQQIITAAECDFLSKLIKPTIYSIYTAVVNPLYVSHI